MKLVKFFFLLVEYNLKRELEFRLNAFIELVIYLGWFVLALFSLELIFGQISAVAGWVKEEVYILSAVYFLFLALTKAIFHSSLAKFTDAVRTGYLDFWLLKPIPTRFLASTNRVQWAHLIRFLTAMVILKALLNKFGFSPNFTNWLQFCLLFSSGLWALYAVTFIVSTTAFWFINLFNLNHLWDELYSLGSKPAQIYQGLLEPVFFVVIPIALIATLPTQALLGNLPPIWLAAGPLIALALMIISQGFWRFALSRYTSASS